eukprot:5250305-Prymnesium_polylepis.1
MVLVLEAARRVLQALNKHQVIADLLADISFFIGFVVYPSASTAGTASAIGIRGRCSATITRWTVACVWSPVIVGSQLRTNR